MELLRYTLIADGSSDKTLMNIIKWLLDDLLLAFKNNYYSPSFQDNNNE